MKKNWTAKTIAERTAEQREFGAKCSLLRETIGDDYVVTIKNYRAKYQCDLREAIDGLWNLLAPLK